MRRRSLTLFLCGDVMLGRGVDQILDHPGDPALREASVRDARDYVGLAEAVNGPVPRPAGDRWPWGDALAVLEESSPGVRIVNLETSVTRSDDFWPGKAVHYRMNPANLSCLAVARPDVCALANNHVMDFGRRGLAETLDALTGAGFRAAGAGREIREARRPVVLTPDGGGRVLVFSCGMESSGVPASWAATADRSGVDLVPEPAHIGTAEIAGRVRRAKGPGDLVVVSLHWGSNWGYHVPPAQRRFAHALVDAGVDVVHGHSSHHPRPVEVYRDRLVLYGCGDLIDDYEGIAGYERYRDDLRLLYFASLDADTGSLLGLTMIPMRARRLRLDRACDQDAEWLRAVLDQESHAFGAAVAHTPDGTLTLHPR
ncbi:CapA family protein [Sphaerisporangium sp. NPDC005289]|uniref:CapA family protein n=1 Tax=Sphaerisporangium sp. NPDC005289 TaxID=3155247 RepID=UPI0033AF71B9